LPSDRSPAFKNIALPLLAAGISVFCAGWVLIHIRRYGVSIPFWDEWDYVRTMRALSNGELSWPRLLVLRSGEHQIFSMFAYSAAAWHLTHLHLKTVMVWNWCIAASFCVLAALITWRGSAGDKAIAWFTLGASSFLVFNPGGYQVMLWGLPPVYSLLSLSFLIGVCLAQSTLPAGVKIIGAGLVCLFASFVLGNGLLFWIALPAILLLHDDFRYLRKSRGSVFVFGLLLGLAIAGYVVGFATHSGSTPGGSGWNVIGIGLFFLALTGNFVSLSTIPQPVHLAQAAGALILLLFAVAAPAALRGRTVGQRRIALVWALFGLFWLLSGLLAASARQTFGTAYALDASRYVTESSFFLLATLVLAVLALRDSPVKLSSFLVPAVAILLLAAIVCRYPQTGTANAAMENSYYSQLLGKTAADGAGLLELPAFRNIFPGTSFAEFESDVRFLNSQGWLRPAMWDERFLRHLNDATSNSFCGRADSVTRTSKSVNLQGWGYLPNRSQRAHAVIIAGFEAGQIPKILGVASVGGERPDVAAALRLSDALSTGWTIDLPLAAFDTHRYVLQSFAYDAETGETCEMPGGHLPP
jgi:hypothetical protein